MKLHLITHTTAVAAGLAVGLAAAGAPEVEAKTLPVDIGVQMELTGAAKTTVLQFIANRLCPSADTEHGMPAGTCDAGKTHWELSVRGYPNGTVTAAFNPQLVGTWTPGTPP